MTTTRNVSPELSAPASTTSSAPPTGTSQPSTPAGALPRLGGSTLLSTDGSFKPPYSIPPASQYSHFTAEGVNLYRIRDICMALMTPTLGGSIDNGFFSTYDALFSPP
ncbi:hypothetical protein BC629DRAFT_1598955 [Irpex lacteus]|nr:hypothetical protein BC629DRAFT_1598955 [Irpex lacteus]